MPALRLSLVGVKTTKRNIMTQEGVNIEAVANPQRSDTTSENFATLRKKLERLEQEKQALAEEIKRDREEREQEWERRVKALSGVKDEENSYEDESYISKKELKNFLKKYEEHHEKKLQELEQKQLAEIKNQTFMSQATDFYDVVTEENVKKLEESDPYFAKVLKSVHDKNLKLEVVYGKLKEMQQKTQKAETAKGPHPYVAASPFGQSGYATTSSGVERMTDPKAREEARQLFNDIKRGFFSNRGA